MQKLGERFIWRLDWNLLRTFTVVVEQGGVTRAAEFLNLSQPTISSALKRLEDTAGKKLLDRRPGHFLLTVAGEALYREAAQVFGSVARLPSLMAAAEQVVKGHLTFAMTSHVVSPHLDALLEEFSQNYPDVTYSLTVTDSADVLSRLRQNQASFGFCLTREEDPNLAMRMVYREFFALYCGPNHPLFGRKDIRLEELSGLDSVSFQTEIENGPLYLVRQLRERVLLNPEPRAVSANLPEIRRCIIAGLGVGSLPLHVVSREVREGKLWQVPPYDDLPAIDIMLVSNPRRSFNPAEAAFLQMMNDMLDRTPIEERIYR